MIKKKEILLLVSGGIITVVLLAGGYIALKSGKGLILKAKEKLKNRYIATLPMAEEPLLLSDYETEEDLGKWEFGNAVGDVSVENSSSGRYSMRIRYLPASESAWAGLKDYLQQDKQFSNWSGYQVLALDIFNPSSERQRMFLQIRDSSGGRLKKEIFLEPNANNPITIDIQQLWDMLNPTDISEFKLFLWNNTSEKYFFIDNIRLLPENAIPKEHVDFEELAFIPDKEVNQILSACFREPFSGSRWWSEKEVKNLNVMKDLKRPLHGRDFIVDGTKGGDETGDGSLSSPWKTIGYGVRQLSAGDTLLIAAGRYRENVVFSSAGTEENPILIGPLGNGEVVIDASTPVGEWAKYSGSIYKAECLYEPVAVVLDDEPIFPEFSLEKVDQGKWHYDIKDHTLYLYIDDAEGPENHEIGVVADPQGKDAVFMNHAKYVTLYGLTIKYSNGKGIKILGDHNKVIKCNIEFNGRNGITVFSYGSTITTDTHIIKNNIYHNCIRNWPRGRYEGGGWDSGVGGGDAPNTYFIGNFVGKNGGEGLSAAGENNVFFDNIVYDNWSVNLYICNESGAVVANNLIFCQDPDKGELYNNRDKTPQDGRNLKWLHAEGIMTADEHYPVMFKNASIVNNIIIGCRRGITHYGLKSTSGLKNVLIANNTIILPSREGRTKNIGIKIPYNNGNNYNVGIFNNIIYGDNQNSPLLFIEADRSKNRDYLDGLNFKNNIWYNPNNDQVFDIASFKLISSANDIEGWKKIYLEKNTDFNDRFIDPRLTNAAEFTPEAAMISSDSAAINSGMPMEAITIDYNSNKRRGDSPTIGALEFVYDE